ncbi:MAG: FMN-binding protein [Candidatus Omnitrophica bacterium]|nr:FMN-binding protein [Candidatus Omnitrophota bacterium]
MKDGMLDMDANTNQFYLTVEKPSLENRDTCPQFRKGKVEMKKEFLLTLFLLTVLLPISSAADSAYVDGVYEGEYSFVKVQVTIKNGDISDIETLHHGGGGKKYADMITPLRDKIIERQSTEVDAITGATVSSRNFKNAVENALSKALSK